MEIQFLGAADCVTGSRHLVTSGPHRVLLDCGLFQGWKMLRERNWSALAVPPHEIDAVILSHAHLDHSGWLPALVQQGFRGHIWCSAATRDLAEVLLLDAAKLQEEDARRANRGGWSRHTPARPLYTTKDARRAIERLRPVATGRPFEPLPGLRAELTPVGHLLGACAVTLRDADHALVFSGDVGRSDDPMLPAPLPMTAPLATAPDLLVVESTYGNRLHPADHTAARLDEIIRQTVERGGKVLIPTFAVGRAQTLMLLLHRLRAEGGLPEDLPVYLDSPMAQEATAIYAAHRHLLRLSKAEARGFSEGIKPVPKAQDSARLSHLRKPAVILSSSGMATGGRVLGHLAALAPDPRNAIVFPGYQVPGSRGGKLVRGAKEIKVMGQYVAVNAPVHHLEGLSGHADADGLIAWMRQMPTAPRQVMVVHGEPEASDALRIRIQESLGWPARVPQVGERLRLGG